MPTREMLKDAASAAEIKTPLTMLEIQALLTSEGKRVIIERRSWTAVLRMAQFPCRVSAGALRLLLGADLIAEAGKGVCLPLAPSVASWRAAYFGGQQQPLLCNPHVAARILSHPQVSRLASGAQQMARLPVACILDEASCCLLLKGSIRQHLLQHLPTLLLAMLLCSKSRILKPSSRLRIVNHVWLWKAELCRWMSASPSVHHDTLRCCYLIAGAAPDQALGGALQPPGGIDLAASLWYPSHLFQIRASNSRWLAPSA